MNTATRRKEGVIVPPLSEAAIANTANLLRGFMPQGGSKYLPVLALYEMLWVFDDEAQFEVVEDHLMGDDDARTYPERGLIMLRQSVYDGAARGEHRARFTMCHELGHLGLHRWISFARVNPVSPPKIYQNSEWQADVFASHLLMPTNLVKEYDSVRDVVQDFGVSFTAAETRLRKMKKGTMKHAS